MLKETDRFPATDSDGGEYTVVQYTDFISCPTAGASGLTEEMVGQVQYRLADGTDLHSIDADTFANLSREGLPLIHRAK